MSAGRPLAYKTVEELQAKIDDYFEACKPEYVKDEKGNPVLDKYGNIVILSINPPTVTGLALHLGFTSRQAVLNYEGRAKFVDAIKRAKLRIESYAEQRLYDPAIKPQGAIFALKNFGWKDQQDVNLESKGGVLVVPGIVDESAWEKNAAAQQDRLAHVETSEQK